MLKSAEDTSDLFRILLVEICKRFPAHDGTFVRVSCTWGSSAVSVSPDGFLFLEAAEDAMQSAEQNLELVVVDKILSGHLLSAVASRLARQQGKGVDSRVIVRVPGIQCEDKDSASAISSLMQHFTRNNDTDNKKDMTCKMFCFITAIKHVVYVSVYLLHNK